MTSTADIRTKHVRFDSAGTDLRGTLHLPADMSGPLPAVVVTGTWTSIKQQMADRYAAALASRGFAALSFDFAGFGDSAGDPRDVEDPQAKVRDIRAAVDFVTTHPTVDQGRVHAVGVCASAGYNRRQRSGRLPGAEPGARRAVAARQRAGHGHLRRR